MFAFPMEYAENILYNENGCINSRKACFLATQVQNSFSLN